MRYPSLLLAAALLGSPEILARDIATPAAKGYAGRLLATGGASSIEGSAGGGVVPWAVIAGYGTDEQWGGAAFATRVDSGDYTLTSRGIALGWRNRVEIGLARQDFGLPTLADALALPTRHFRQDIAHAKLRLAGDLVYSPWPQLSLGLQHKRQRDFLVPSLVGAVDDSGNDVYLAATKLFLGGAGGRNLLLNGVLRSSNANQTGLLGFGGDARRGRSLLGEASVAVLLDPRWAVGVEYRQKPDNLGFAREHDWKDVFVGWFPNKRVAVVAAYADLGSIATLDRQEAWYVSVQISH
ncbi:DUF3034 family protein [Rehaibacterium terrae]|jgi:hypothetical protein|uniref:DUF3034 family protein n=1 Tax=Rehaibacterium terrae TaxID=1341696 RepID=A0A7W7V7J4_9GAMM|nr:DUF3034 family protein [Rehaibacterium terrae]MBB5014684.1 hypothetical protein [Rehaibacterium terrae]